MYLYINYNINNIRIFHYNVTTYITYLKKLDKKRELDRYWVGTKKFILDP